MMDKAHAMVLAAFAADSLSLGAHWIYDTGAIRERFGRVDRLMPPAPDSFHPTKQQGDFTHYGDQMLVLLESVVAKNGFELNDFAARWRALFDGYGGYVDAATRMTLAGFAAEKMPAEAGSASEDMAGAARMAPVVCVHRNDLKQMIQAVRTQAALTHRHPSVLDAAEFFARTAHLCLNGTPPEEAMCRVVQHRFPDSQMARWVKAGLKSIGEDSVAAIERFGQSCHTGDLFPGVVHLVARYQDDLREAVVQAAMAGGDSATRGTVTALVLGAWLGRPAVPDEWVSGLTRLPHLEQLLGQLR